ncbi:hypothetical protein [Viscerimonas tarda]
MKTRMNLRKNRILYRVDPKKLSIRIFNKIYSFNRQIRISTREKAQLEEDEKLEIFSSDTFPVEFGGIWYFDSEDEALNFVKRQIGF